MQIGITSDIHVDFSQWNREIVNYIIEAFAEEKLDVLIICGDISPDPMALCKVLSSFSMAGVAQKRLFVAGNHDIWIMTENRKGNSHDKYELITKICSESGFHHLCSEPVVIDNIGFCGTIGWYDYSYKSAKYDIPETIYESKTYSGLIWNDLRYARWGASDKEMATFFESKLEKQIHTIKDQVVEIVVATHHVPFREFVLYRDDPSWDFFSAFMGSERLGEICRSEPAVRYAFFGHTHIVQHKNIGKIRAISSPIGYITDKPKDLRKYTRKRLNVIKI